MRKKVPDKRNRLEIEKLKEEMLGLLGRGLTRQDIGKVMADEPHKIPGRTFDRYWSNLMKAEEDKLFKHKERFLVGFMQRHEHRLRQAQLNYSESKTKTMPSGNLRWWYAGLNCEMEAMKFLSGIGALKMKPQELEITLKMRLLNALEETREDVRKAKGNI